MRELTQEEKDMLVDELKEHPRMQFTELAHHMKRWLIPFKDWSDEELLLALARTSWNMR